jgi:putative ABC transport system permease protein
MPIEPWAVYTGPDKYMNYIMARVDMNRLETIKSEMKRIWESRISTYPFELSFIDETVKEAYEKDRQLSHLIISFTVLAIIIASLGLFGLASYLAEKRTKGDRHTKSVRS